jgi:hypothetical protein
MSDRRLIVITALAFLDYLLAAYTQAVTPAKRAAQGKVAQMIRTT